MCPLYSAENSSKPRAELVNISTTKPMKLVCIDFLSLERSKGGYENILVITDHFTRYAQAFPTKNQLAKTTAKVLFDNFLSFIMASLLAYTVIREEILNRRLLKNNAILLEWKSPGNGMVERFNQTLLNMLDTLRDDQKQHWKTYVAPFVHSYNATRHDSTGYSPFFLMFGRHPRLAVDACLGIQTPAEPISSRAYYATKLKDRLNFAYKVAAREAEKSADRNKVHYDLKVREATLDIGDRVLIRNVGFRGKHKLADKWDKDSYVVIGIPDKSIPVYKVQKDLGDHSVKTLHRNMLLPFSAIPGLSEVSVPDTTRESLPKLRKPRSKTPNVQLNCRTLNLIQIPMIQLFQCTLFRQGVMVFVI